MAPQRSRATQPDCGSSAGIDGGGTTRYSIDRLITDIKAIQNADSSQQTQNGSRRSIRPRCESQSNQIDQSGGTHTIASRLAAASD
jgi:hypothetical protein